MPKFLFFYLSNIALRFIVLTESNGATHLFDIILISLNRPKQHGLLHHGSLCRSGISCIRCSWCS